VARAAVVTRAPRALQVKVASVGNTSNNNWEPLGSSGAGVRLEPGETAVGVRSANPTELDGGFIRLEADASSLLEDANPADNVVTVSVPVTEVFGTITGILYGDANGSLAPDPGEGLAGVEVRASGGNPSGQHVATTDSTGRFTFDNVPANLYDFGVVGPWRIVGARRSS
jgi:hypothetical protein